MGECKFKDTGRSGLYLMVFIILYLSFFFPQGCLDVDNEDILNKLEVIEEKLDAIQPKN